MLKTRCIVAGYTLVIVPETVGSEQRGPVKDSRQRYSISGDRRADIKPKPANEHQQQPDIVAQVGKHFYREFIIIIITCIALENF